MGGACLVILSLWKPKKLIKIMALYWNILASKSFYMDKKATWEGILTRLTSTISRAHILSFFKDSIILEIDNGEMTIAVPTIIAFNFIRDRYQVKILEVAKELNPEIKGIKFQIKGSLLDEEHPDKIELKVINTILPQKTIRKVPNKGEVLMGDGVRSKIFNPHYTLDNFIAGNENRLVHAACMAVAAKPGNIYNPLYIYGGVGLGKTHLLQATGRQIVKNYPDKKVVYMTSERFINEIIEAIGKKHTRSFKEKYRKIDCLIIDDIQFFGNKASSQQEFFHTFNELYDAGKQLIISSDRPPNELDGLERRLTSRFNMGMVTEVVLPDFETRLAILNAKCQEHQVLMEREVLEFMAYNVHNSVRELEGILVNAIAEAELTESTPTIKTVGEAIRRISCDTKIVGIDLDEKKRITVRTIEDVIEIVADYYKVTKSELVGEDRRKEFMIPRQICMFLIRELLSQSYETIGESFSGRNHTTVIHAYNKVVNRLKEDDKIKRDINALKKEMGV